jgi:hypothetical protein
VSWLTGRSEKSRTSNVSFWQESLMGEFAQAEQDGLLTYGNYDRVAGATVETVFLTRRSLYARCYNELFASCYGPITIVPLDRIVVAGPIGRRSCARWGVVVDNPDADVERGQEPLVAYAYECRDRKGAGATGRDFVSALRAQIPAGRFRLLPGAPTTADPGRAQEVELLMAATLDDPARRSDLERAWEVLGARSRGMPVPDRTVRSEAT